MTTTRCLSVSVVTISLSLQLANFVFFCASIYLFLPSFWLTFVLVLYEGVLGGGIYVNAFYTITLQVSVSKCVWLMSTGARDTP